MLSRVLYVAALTAALWLLTAISPTFAQSTDDQVQRWSSEELQRLASALPIENDRKQGVSTIGRWGNHFANLERLEGRTAAEIHDGRADIIIVQAGRIRLTLGGTVTEGSPAGPGETRGTSIDGGTTQVLSAGDIAHIPPKMPHQLDASGDRAVFLVIKVNQP